MSTKNNPGPHDCYAKAAPDEPMFILLARDPMAPELVRQWAFRRWHEGEDLLKSVEAIAIADAMEKWRLANPPEQIRDAG